MPDEGKNKEELAAEKKAAEEKERLDKEAKEEAERIAKEKAEQTPPPNVDDEITKTKEKLEELKKLDEELGIKAKDLAKKSEEIALRGRGLNTPTPTLSEHDKWAKEAKERYAGTGMDPT